MYKDLILARYAVMLHQQVYSRFGVDKTQGIPKISERVGVFPGVWAPFTPLELLIRQYFQHWFQLNVFLR
jgi:hypothetical protein